MSLFYIFWIIGLCTTNIEASTHWMVTETGLIQPKIGSQFEMARPYDLLAFLNQDTRWDNIIKLYNDLSKRQEVVDYLWSQLEENSNMQHLQGLDKFCFKVDPSDSVDWYKTFVEDGRSKGIGDEEFLLYNLDYGDTDVPDCKRISSLTFSMSSFEHLESMIRREYLSVSPEPDLQEQISPPMSVDQFGHWVAAVLRKNSSSWLHYNLASLYWRIKGKAPKAMECSRRAIHYAPRQYKVITLYTLGSLLHCSKMAEDAIILLEAAIDHDAEFPISHFVLANAYAVVGDFNSSIKHYEQSLKLKPSFLSLVNKHRNVIQCYSFLLSKLDNLQENLIKLREHLVEYGYREAHWIKSQAAFLRTMKHSIDFDYTNVEKVVYKMSDLTGLDVNGVKRRGDQNSLILYFLDSPMYDEQWFNKKGLKPVESLYNIQNFLKHISTQTTELALMGDIALNDPKPENYDDSILEEIGPIPAFPDMFADVKGKTGPERSHANHDSRKAIDRREPIPENMSEYEIGVALYPPSMKINRNREDFDKELDWPSNKLCKDAAPYFPDKSDAIYPIFMPFENKGIRITGLLTDKIGVPVSVEHELPWHPPVCKHDKDAAAFTHKSRHSQKLYIVREVASTDLLKKRLLEYVGDGDMEAAKHMQDVEIGQRIFTAVHKKIAPRWLLYTLSSLYWRVRGNNVNALHCLHTASKRVESKYRDIVWTSLASVYLEMGYFDEALAAAEEAFKLNLYEPATNFLLSEINMLKKHRNTHLFHMKQVLRVEPNFMGGIARKLLIGWSCILKQVNAYQELEFGEGDICTQVEPGISMVCGKDGSNCHMTNLNCHGHEHEGSTIVRMLKIRQDSIEGVSQDHIDKITFDKFVFNMPMDRSNKLAHQKNYDAMMEALDTFLKGCTSRGCMSVHANDMTLKEEDCTYQHVQLGYWLHFISFRQLLTDSDSKFPSEITSTSQSNKKIPECRILMEPSKDFFLEKLSHIDSEGWEPVLTLMHQFAEVFDLFDYVTLGAKIAKYVETHPSSWVGAMAAGWWCGAGGRGGCALRCLRAALALSAPHPQSLPLTPRMAQLHTDHAAHALTALAMLLHSQSKRQDAKNVAYLSFYNSPKSKTEAFLVAVSHTYFAEYDQALWMYRYALKFDQKFLPAKACLHATMCLVLFGDNTKGKPKEN